MLEQRTTILMATLALVAPMAGGGAAVADPPARGGEPKGERGEHGQPDDRGNRRQRKDEPDEPSAAPLGTQTVTVDSVPGGCTSLDAASEDDPLTVQLTPEGGTTIIVLGHSVTGELRADGVGVALC